MSEQIVQVADASPSTKNMRTIQQTAGGNTVQSEVVILATGASNGGDTYDARQIRALTSADIVTAILQGVTLGQKTMASSLPVVVASDQSALPVSGTVTANQGTAKPLSGAWPVELTDATNGPAAIELFQSSNVAGVHVHVDTGDVVQVSGFGGTFPILPYQTGPTGSFSSGNQTQLILQLVAASVATGTVQLVGNWKGFVVCEVSFDSQTTWTQVPVRNAVTGQWLQNMSMNGVYLLNTFNATLVRLRNSVSWSGTATFNTGLSDSPLADLPSNSGGVGQPVPPNAVYLGVSNGPVLQPLSANSQGQLQVTEGGGGWGASLFAQTLNPDAAMGGW